MACPARQRMPSVSIVPVFNRGEKIPAVGADKQDPERIAVMGKYILKRIIWLIPIMLFISFVSFSLIHLSPGDPATMYLMQGGQSPDPEAVAILQEKLGLDKPFMVQYVDWLSGVLHGDFGESFYTGRPVSEEIADLFPNTIKLTALAMAMTLLVSIPLGIVCATHENRPVDYIIRTLSFINSSLPGFFAAMLLIYFLGVRLKWLPTVSSGHTNGIWMPAITLTICLSAGYTRQVRTAVIAELGEDYIRMKRARGIRERTILYRDALKSAMPAILTVAGINAGQLLGGTAIIESVCTYQGLGRLAVSSITNRDYPLMQGYILLMAIIYVLVNLLVDLLHAAADRRVRNRFIEEAAGGGRHGK